MILHLCRIEHTGDRTRGVLHIPGLRPLVTIEQEWRPTDEFPFGEPGNSCVPTGTYELVQAHSPSRGRRMWYLDGDGVAVRDDDRPSDIWRWGCMFHVANWSREVQGCIGPGMRWGEDNVLHSRNALETLHEKLWGAMRHTLVIR